MMKFTALIISLAAFLSAIWIVMPAPTYHVWLFSVAASEWSLWIAMISLAAIIISLYLLFSDSINKTSVISLTLSSLSLIFALYPFVSAYDEASALNVRLSFQEYFSAVKISASENRRIDTFSLAEIDGTELLADVYRPTVKNENNEAAVIVVHGGSWKAGKRSDFPQWNEWLAGEGFTVFDIDYRLAPQPNYLTAVGDVKCAVIQIKERAAEFGIAPDRIALFGRSAGAHLALLAAYSANEQRLLPSCSAVTKNETVRAVVSFYAPVDLIWGFDNPANMLVLDGPQTLEDFLGGNPHSSEEIRERFVLASPLTHVSKKTPPTFLVHGGKDQLVREENTQFADQKLNKAGIAHKTIFIPYAQHGFDYNFHGFGSQITKPLMLEFLRENTK